jgi:hypothetical protein
MVNQQTEIPVAVAGLPRKLGFLDAVSIVIGSVIGAAFFWCRAWSHGNCGPQQRSWGCGYLPV